MLRSDPKPFKAYKVYQGPKICGLKVLRVWASITVQFESLGALRVCCGIEVAKTLSKGSGGDCEDRGQARRISASPYILNPA